MTDLSPAAVHERLMKLARQLMRAKQVAYGLNLDSAWPPGLSLDQPRSVELAAISKDELTRLRQVARIVLEEDG